MRAGPGVATGLGGDFNRIWSAYTVQTIGEGVLIAALPLLAARVTGNPLLISWVGFAQELPWLLLAIPGGIIVDRHDRRRLMLGAQAGQAAALLVVATLASLHLTWLWALYLLAFVLGSGDVIVSSASKAIIPALVAKDQFEKANARNVTVETIGRQFAGPPLGSALFAFALPLPFWFNAITYLLSLILIKQVRHQPGRFLVESPNAVSGSRWKGATEGIRFLMANPLLRAVILLACVSNFTLFMSQAVLVLFAHTVLGVGSTGYGILVAGMALGGVAGGFTSHRIVEKVGTRRLVRIVPLLSGLSLLLIGLVGRNMVIVICLYFVRSANLAIWNVMAQSLSQRMVPNELRGRTISAGRMIAFGSLPLGALAGGLVASDISLPATWTIGGAIHLLVALSFLPVLLKWPREAAPEPAVKTA
ncbi:MAG TPA: MFS transporter [Pseudonocardiaceae bacterium]|jgi:MFS family permease